MQSSPHPPKTKEDRQYYYFFNNSNLFDKLLPFNIASYQSPLYLFTTQVCHIVNMSNVRFIALGNYRYIHTPASKNRN
jgi:hypothetical protein